MPVTCVCRHVKVREGGGGEGSGSRQSGLRHPSTLLKAVPRPGSIRVHLHASCLRLRPLSLLSSPLSFRPSLLWTHPWRSSRPGGVFGGRRVSLLPLRLPLSPGSPSPGLLAVLCPLAGLEPPSGPPPSELTALGMGPAYLGAGRPGRRGSSSFTSPRTSSTPCTCSTLRTGSPARTPSTRRRLEASGLPGSRLRG